MHVVKNELHYYVAMSVNDSASSFNLTPNICSQTVIKGISE